MNVLRNRLLKNVNIWFVTCKRNLSAYDPEDPRVRLEESGRRGENGSKGM
jgi:hypothetical protein